MVIAIIVLFSECKATDLGHMSCFVSDFDIVLMRMVITQVSWLRYTKSVSCHPEKCVHSPVLGTEISHKHLTPCLAWFTISSEFLSEDGPVKI